MNKMKTALYCYLLTGSALILISSGCEKEPEKNNVSKNKNDKVSVISDKPLTAFRKDLIDIAFKTASSIPVNPHIKDRSKMQELVVATCLNLDQPRQAMEYTERIGDWRRGLCYADLAYYYAQRGGDVNEINRYLKLAEDISPVSNQDWQRDSIKARIAQTHILLKQNEQAALFDVNLEDSQTGKTAQTRAIVSDENSFEEQLKANDTIIASGNFDVTKNLLQAYTQLYNRYYNDPNRRSLLEEKIRAYCISMPASIRIEILMEMAGFAVINGDNGKAIKLVDEGQTVIEGGNLPLEQQIEIKAKLASLRFKAGEIEKAITYLDAAKTQFTGHKASIVNIYRAGALRPVAEAYQAMGDTKDALSVYKQVVEEGTTNINSRPRAEDLVATCCSMATSAVEPDAELWARIRQISGALGEPW